MTIRKAVITAAGWGTRFLPATKAQPKETLPLVDKPIIQYVVEEAVAAGITQIVIVTASGKRAIEDHFDRSFELESVLEKKGDLKNLEAVRRISELADICYLRQKQQLGLGHAILSTRSVIGNEPFAVFLPDDLIHWHIPAMKQMIDVYERVGQSVVAVEKINRDDTSKYGIIDPQPVSERVFRVRDLVEKPAPDDAPSDLGIVGRYILTPEIFAMLDQTTPGRGGEIQLTDGLKRLLSLQEIYAYQFEGIRYDTGNPLGLLEASIEYALRRDDIGPVFRSYLEKLVRGGVPISQA
ncbi:MAG: UTP--glucose-1-phosphate uridylyltransferase GalU [Dehalococcoidia bacterium]|nr:UTP--glucose-1-phosphate uridylyltransferase GalU [Dehalococcoidia bacterium]